MALHCIGSVVFLGDGITRASLEGVLKAVTHPLLGNPKNYRSLETVGVANSGVFNVFDCFFVQADQNAGPAVEKQNTVMRVIAAKNPTSTTLPDRIRPISRRSATPAPKSRFRPLDLRCRHLGLDFCITTDTILIRPRRKPWHAESQKIRTYWGWWPSAA